MKKREHTKKPQKLHELEKRTKTILYIILLFVGVFGLLNTSLTGFSINSSAYTIAGSFLGVIGFFFIILLFLLKLKAKPYKSLKAR